MKRITRHIQRLSEMGAESGTCATFREVRQAAGQPYPFGLLLKAGRGTLHPARSYDAFTVRPKAGPITLKDGLRRDGEKVKRNPGHG